MEKRRVFIVVPSLAIGGRERIAINTAECLRPEYETTIIVFQRKETEYETSCPVENLDCPATTTSISRVFIQIKRIWKLAKLRNQKKPDIVFSLGLTANITNVFSGLISKGRSVIAIHGFAEVKKNRLNTFLLNKAAKVVCISKEMQFQLLKLYPGLKHTVVIENGYDIQRIGFNNNTRKYNAQAPRLIAMGRLDAVKRYDLLLKAFKRISEKIPQVTLSILGQGGKEADLKRLAEELELSASVTFLGYSSSPYGILRGHDIFMLTSQNEGFPNALIEALACRLAVVAVDCLSGPKEILSEHYQPDSIQGIVFEKYGVLVENNKDENTLISMISEAVLRLINDKSKIEEYKSLGLERSCDYSLDAYCCKLNALFDDLITQKG